MLMRLLIMTALVRVWGDTTLFLETVSSHTREVQSQQSSHTLKLPLCVTDATIRTPQ